MFQGNITPVIAESRLTSLATCSWTQANSLQPSVLEFRSVHRLSESQLPHRRITTDVCSGLHSPKPRGARSRQRGWAPWLQQIHRAQPQKPAVLTCLPPPHLGNTVSRSLPMWFLPRDRGPQLRNPVHVCSLGCHRTRTPGQCPQLHPCEDEPPGAPNSQGAGCVYLPEGQAAMLTAVRRGRHHPKYEWQPLDHSVEYMSATGSGERLTGDKGCWFWKVKELVR